MPSDPAIAALPSCGVKPMFEADKLATLLLRAEPLRADDCEDGGDRCVVEVITQEGEAVLFHHDG